MARDFGIGSRQITNCLKDNSYTSQVRVTVIAPGYEESRPRKEIDMERCDSTEIPRKNPHYPVREGLGVLY